MIARFDLSTRESGLCAARVLARIAREFWYIANPADPSAVKAALLRFPEATHKMLPDTPAKIDAVDFRRNSTTPNFMDETS